MNLPFGSDDVKNALLGAVGLLSTTVVILSVYIYKIVVGRVSKNERRTNDLQVALNAFKTEVALNYVGTPTLGETKEEFRRDIAQVRNENTAFYAEMRATLSAQSDTMNELRASIMVSINNAASQLESSVERRHNQNSHNVEAMRTQQTLLIESLRKDIIDLWKSRNTS